MVWYSSGYLIVMVLMTYPTGYLLAFKSLRLATLLAVLALSVGAWLRVFINISFSLALFG